MRCVVLAVPVLATGIAMRALVIATFLIAAASAAVAQEAARPAAPAPAASASFDQREAWCQKYASWLVAETEQQGLTPADVRATQRVETELNSCKPDPQMYERETRAEAERAGQSRAG